MAFLGVEDVTESAKQDEEAIVAVSKSVHASKVLPITTPLVKDDVPCNI